MDGWPDELAALPVRARAGRRAARTHTSRRPAVEAGAGPTGKFCSRRPRNYHVDHAPTTWTMHAGMGQGRRGARTHARSRSMHARRPPECEARDAVFVPGERLDEHVAARVKDVHLVVPSPHRQVRPVAADGRCVQRGLAAGACTLRDPVRPAADDGFAARTRAMARPAEARAQHAI